MPRAYATALRERVLLACEQGGASQGEIARRFAPPNRWRDQPHHDSYDTDFDDNRCEALQEKNGMTEGDESARDHENELCRAQSLVQHRHGDDRGPAEDRVERMTKHREPVEGRGLEHDAENCS